MLPPTSYVHAVRSTEPGPVTRPEVSAQVVPVVRHDSAKPTCVRKPYRPSQYVTTASKTGPGRTTTSRVSTCSSAPLAGDTAPRSTRSLQSVDIRRPPATLISRRVGPG